MNILLTVHHFPPKFTGGAELRAYRTAAKLQSLGHCVKVICIESVSEGPVNKVDWVDDQFKEVQVRRLFFNLSESPDPKKWKYNNPIIGDHIRQMINENPPDIFHMFGGYLMTASAINTAHELHIPTVLSLTDFWFYCPRITKIRSNSQLCEGNISTGTVKPLPCARCFGEEKRRYRIPGKIIPEVMNLYWSFQKKRLVDDATRIDFMKFSLNQVNAIISPSSFMRDFYIRSGTDENRIHYMRQGVDQSHFIINKSKEKSFPLKIGYIGLIARHKGVHIAIKAVKQLPDSPIILRIYGNDKQFPEYSSQLKDLSRNDPRIQFLGSFDREDISQVFNQLDILIVPSLWYENSPNVILEAFAHKVPIFASNLGGMAELIQNGINGRLFSPGDPSDLKRILIEAIANPNILAKYIENIPAVKTVDQEMEELIKIYRQVSNQ